MAISIAPVQASVLVEVEIDMIILALLPVTITEKRPKELNCFLETDACYI